MDTDLVRSAMRGDERAFTEIVNSVADRFLGVAHRILRDAALAEDAVQQALLSAWRDLPDLRDPAKFEGWSYRLLIHACYMEARKRKRWHPATIVRSITEPTAPDLIGGIIERERLERGFERLSVEHRAVLILTYYLDLPSEQALKPSTSRSAPSTRGSTVPSRHSVAPLRRTGERPTCRHHRRRSNERRAYERQGHGRRAA